MPTFWKFQSNFRSLEGHRGSHTTVYHPVYILQKRCLRFQQDKMPHTPPHGHVQGRVAPQGQAHGGVSPHKQSHPQVNPRQLLINRACFHCFVSFYASQVLENRVWREDICIEGEIPTSTSIGFITAPKSRVPTCCLCFKYNRHISFLFFYGQGHQGSHSYQIQGGVPLVNEVIL